MRLTGFDKSILEKDQRAAQSAAKLLVQNEKEVYREMSKIESKFALAQMNR